MLNRYENFLVYKGEYYSVYFHAETKNSSTVNEYFEHCDDATQASLLFLAKAIGDTGRIYDETKFRIEDRQNKIYCFKPRKERFFCFFFSGKKIIITSAYPKKKQKLDRRELNKAIKIRQEYFN
ncbi:MAG: type II toxin-antitoxin system RelE/ParE family toxin [Candidatus Omnitrophota bacterium]|jgi:hypothetical protein